MSAVATAVAPISAITSVYPSGAADGSARVLMADNGGALTQVKLRIDNASLASQAVGPPLSDREMEVFQLIGNGYSTRQIAQKLGLSSKTIDSYREHLKQKLSLETGSDLVRHAIQWSRTEASV